MTVFNVFKHIMLMFFFFPFFHNLSIQLHTEERICTFKVLGDQCTSVLGVLSTQGLRVRSTWVHEHDSSCSTSTGWFQEVDI